VSAAAALFLIAASTFHVDPRGADAADGSAAAPWRTLQHAADRVAAGDTVRVHAGRYRGFDLRASGTERAPIRFVADDGVVIDRDNGETPDGINVEEASWVEIEGFTVTGVERAGIRAAECAAVTIRRNRIDRPGTWGVLTGFCDDLLIEGNVVTGARRQHGIYVSNSGDRPIVRGNQVDGCAQSGIQLNGDASEGGDGVIGGAVIEENVIAGNGERGGAGLNLDGVVGATIRNNVLLDNAANGIAVFRIDGGAASTGNRIVNNTILMPARSRWAVHVWDASTGTVIRNNVLLSAHPIRGAIDVSPDSRPGLDSDFNAVIGRFTIDDAETVLDLDGWRIATGQDAHSFEATERQLFVDARDGDVTPREGSPAIDRGSPDGAPDRDLLGHVRPAGAAIDLGAIERCAPGCRAAPRPPDPTRSGERRPTRTIAAPPPVRRGGCCGGAPAASSAALSLGVLVALRRRRRC